MTPSTWQDTYGSHSHPLLKANEHESYGGLELTTEQLTTLDRVFSALNPVGIVGRGGRRQEKEGSDESLHFDAFVVAACGACACSADNVGTVAFIY